MHQKYDGKLCFSVKERGIVWKEYMKIMNKKLDFMSTQPPSCTHKCQKTLNSLPLD